MVSNNQGRPPKLLKTRSQLLHTRSQLLRTRSQLLSSRTQLLSSRSQLLRARSRLLRARTALSPFRYVLLGYCNTVVLTKTVPVPPGGRRQALRSPTLAAHPQCS